MDSNGERQSPYGQGEYGVNWERGLVTLLLAIAAAAFLLSIAGMGG